jgi:hypothetical protein
MNNTLAIPRGVTACFSKAGLALGDGAKTGPAIVAPNGAGIDFAIDGNAYHKADAATVLPLTATTVQPVLTKCLYVMQVDAGGTVTSVQGVPVLTADLTAGKAALHFPEPTLGKCPFGAVKVETQSTATFTPGTTALDAANIVETYYDFLGGMPSNPLTS